MDAKRTRHLTSDLHALVTGLVAGALSRPDLPLKLKVEIERDADGNYLPRILVTGSVSGERIVVTVEPAP